MYVSEPLRRKDCEEQNEHNNHIQPHLRLHQGSRLLTEIKFTILLI